MTVEGPASGGSDRSSRLYQAVDRHQRTPGPQARIEAICHACVEVLPVTGAGVMLMAERAHQGTLFATDERILELEDLQNAAAEGPCLDSYNLGRPVFAPDLADGGRRTWPLLAARAMAVGIRALFSFPLQVDDTPIGALDLYRAEPGGLARDEVDDARLLAAMTTREVMALHADGAPGSLPTRVADLSGDRIAIEQATGMVAAQTGTDIIEAARRLRAFSGEVDTALAELAHQVVDRKVRFTPA